jgi:hypothetical protein
MLVRIARRLRWPLVGAGAAALMAVSVAGATNNAPLVVAQNNTATIQTSLQGSMSTPVFLISNFSAAAGAYGLSVNGHSSSTPAIGGGNDSTGIGFRGLSTLGIGAQGLHTGTASDADAGVEGQSNATSGTGVKGIATNGSSAKAVYGVSNSGYGGYFTALSPGGWAVYAKGETYGVRADSPNGRGVYGTSSADAGVEGFSSAFDGVYGSTSNATYAGTSGHGGQFGVYGLGAASGSTFGVWGGGYTGVQGDTGSHSPCSYCPAVRGYGHAGYGGFFSATDTGGIGVWAEGPTAGDFQGDVIVNGTLSKTAGSFRIDHPLHPATEYLQHSFVESPDMMNVYNGNVATDANGFATVKLPVYFQALNRSFRYQLTVVGKAHWDAKAAVWNEVKDNRFTIRTDQPDVKVSWQVTGVRHDVYANANRIKVVVPKASRDRGKYLFPELYGKSKSASIGPEK